MSELLNTKKQRENFRRNLLTNVSMFALLGYLGVSSAAAADEGRPVLWLELGGQAEQLDSTQTIFAPLFFNHTPAIDLTPMIAAQKTPSFSIGEEGKIIFEPEDTNWVFSAAIRYGKADGAKHIHQQTALPYVKRYLGGNIFPQPEDQIFGDGQTNSAESHFIVDFQAGKDVGLGLFGAHGNSVVSAGVRFAQFTSSSNISLHARPNYRSGAVHSGKRYYPPYGTQPGEYFGYRTFDHFRHTYTGILRAKRNMHAFGPSVSWNASVPVAGNGSDMKLLVDWGVAGAVLFGRQHAHIHHQTTGHYYEKTGRPHKYPGVHRQYINYTHAPADRNSSRTITIPNVGGFAGASLQFLSAKVSIGYRADFFWGAVDDGIDTRQSKNVGFYGPFATISVGIGG
jgi:hypothetical protein